jgi:hypothetical protein
MAFVRSFPQSLYAPTVWRRIGDLASDSVGSRSGQLSRIFQDTGN